MLTPTIHMDKHTYIHLFLDFGTVHVHSNQKFNFAVKLEHFEEGTLTAAQVHHLDQSTAQTLG